MRLILKKSRLLLAVNKMTAKIHDLPYSTTTRFIRPLIFGIETSCDDTGVAIVGGDGRILGECVKSQQTFSTRFGGVVPLFAATQHEANLQVATTSALSDAGLTVEDMDAVAVTVRPGLVVCLAKGLRHALEICRKFNKPLIPVHHMQAHALTCRFTDQVHFPYICLLISGGHSLIVWVQSISRFIILGRNLDCAPGDLLDKVARRLQLSHIDIECSKMSGGALVEKFAKLGDPFKFGFKVPSTKFADCNFSFSGIFVQAMKQIQHLEKFHGIQGGKLIPEFKDICASIQHTTFKHLARKIMRAFEYVKLKGWAANQYENQYPATLVVSGGVAANSYIRSGLGYLCSKYNTRLACPPQRFCTDNGVMIAWNALEKWRAGQDLIYNLPLDYYVDPKCPIGENVSSDVIAQKLNRRAMNALTSCMLNIDFNKIDLEESSENLISQHMGTADCDSLKHALII